MRTRAGRRKSIDALISEEGPHRLRRTLSWPHLIALGVGAIVGTGIYTLTGVGADRAGPGVILGFAIAGVVCACAALAYTELATLIPAAGSAYTYSYAILGEGIAWVVGWSLILEYTVVCSAVAVGWAGYAGGFLRAAGIGVPDALLSGPHAGGIINLPAILIVVAVTGLLLLGVRKSANVTAVLVLMKIIALIAFIVLALPAFKTANFTPFMPYGFSSHIDHGEVRGVMAAAAIIFFAFYGFDAVSTAAEETIQPKRDLVIGIVGSMLVCTLLYMAVGAAAVGAMPYREFAQSPEPLALILRKVNQPEMAGLIAIVAILALPTVILAFLYGQTRVFFAMARDGLLPAGLGKISPKSGAPVAMTLVTALVVSAIAGFFPLAEIAELANAGTLCAFIATSVCMLVLQRREPERPRLFKTPLPWIVGPLAIAGCLYLFQSLPQATQIRFFIWNMIGLGFYVAYGIRKSKLAVTGDGAPTGSN